MARVAGRGGTTWRGRGGSQQEGRRQVAAGGVQPAGLEARRTEVARRGQRRIEEVGRQLARARRRVYFSPRFIGRRLRHVRDLRDLPALARKAWRLLTSAGFDRV